MRVIAPFFSVAAAVVTIVAGIIRLRWSAIQHRVKTSPRTERTALPLWVKRTATVWLVVVGSAITFVILFVFVKTVISLSA